MNNKVLGTILFGFGIVIVIVFFIFVRFEVRVEIDHSINTYKQQMNLTVFPDGYTLDGQLVHVAVGPYDKTMELKYSLYKNDTLVDEQWITRGRIGKNFNGDIFIGLLNDMNDEGNLMDLYIKIDSKNYRYNKFITLPNLLFRGNMIPQGTENENFEASYGEVFTIYTYDSKTEGSLDKGNKLEITCRIY